MNAATNSPPPSSLLSSFSLRMMLVLFMVIPGYTALLNMLARLLMPGWSSVRPKRIEG